MIFRLHNFFLVLSFILFMGCSSGQDTHDLRPNDSNPNIPNFSRQGWNEEMRQTFYHAPQGTRLIRYDWFLALEQASNSKRFLDDDNLIRLGIIPDHNTLKNPDELPVGFVKSVDSIDKQTWVGLTCAACHTLEISYKNKTIRIDGGPSMLDAMALLAEIGGAVHALVMDGLGEEKFSRFAKAVLKKQHNNTTQKLLREQVEKYDQLLQKPHDIAKELKIDLYPNKWGKGRLDALGRGGNTVLLPLDRANLRPANAPVSFPAIWNTWGLNWVQWNGAVRQPMGRNLLQAIGLNANLTLDPDTQQVRTSASVTDLARIEKLVQKLEPPPWSVKLFDDIDQAKASRGAILYDQHCAHCHVPKLTEPNKYGRQFKEVVLIPLKEIGTDPLSATNFHNRTVKSGPLGLGLLTVADTAQYLTNKILEGQYKELNMSQEQQEAWSGYRPNTMQAPLAYVARPHSGVWALAPYLHNGSIPNLYQLLSPKEERDDVFYVGHSEFDPRHVGFVSEKKNSTDFKFDTSLPGNSNAGHEFRDGKIQNGVIGPALSEEERFDLIEYLKTI
jgi:mono/diheme cytochrome c family protein